MDLRKTSLVLYILLIFHLQHNFPSVNSNPSSIDTYYKSLHLRATKPDVVGFERKDQELVVVIKKEGGGGWRGGGGGSTRMGGGGGWHGLLGWRGGIGIGGGGGWRGWRGGSGATEEGAVEDGVAGVAVAVEDCLAAAAEAAAAEDCLAAAAEALEKEALDL
ncbi:hypothetical protein Bca4012_098130 [Brassica carinata]